MRPLFRHAALVLLLFGCASSRTFSAEYSLDPREHPAGVECFYSCLKQLDPHARGTCLSFCDGVEVSVTLEPCAPGSPSLCRGYSIPDAKLTYAAEMTPAEEGAGDDSVVGEILGGLFVGLIEAAICGGDCDGDDDCDEDGEDDYDRRDYNHHQPHAERTRPRKESPPRTERAPKPSSDRRGRPGK
jgi:hypothetical protein